MASHIACGGKNVAAQLAHNWHLLRCVYAALSAILILKLMFLQQLDIPEKFVTELTTAKRIISYNHRRDE